MRALLCLVLVLQLAPAQDAPPRHVDRARLMSDVAALASPAFEGRRTGTPGNLKAREWILEQFRAIGLAPPGPAQHLQPFTVTARGTRAAAANVVGRIAGREPRARMLVITAHYDHLGVRDGMIFHGADDNASGVAAVLAAARHFTAARPRHSMLFAALDAEESGHQGARTLVRSPLIDRRFVAMNINLDMVSRSRRNELYAAGTFHSPWLIPILDNIRTRAAVTLLYGHDRPPARGGGLDDWTHSSDHGPFHDAGIPFLYFGVEDHEDYHKPTDTADRIDPRFFGDAVDTIVEALRAIDARVE
jgi:Zn-dependent M28 family amino/carboxypeptidase